MFNSSDLLGPTDFDTMLEYEAYILTILLKQVNPKIDFDASFHILCDSLIEQGEFDAFSAIDLGLQIKATERGVKVILSEENF